MYKLKGINITRWIILAVLLYMPLFGHLDTLSIRLWDESRLAVNASEMARNNDFLVTYYRGKPDMWNTKPPLLIWIQAGFIKVLGFNELAIRLPSAFAALFTCLLLLLFGIRYLKDFWFGFIAVLVLVTSSGYVDLHATRTGDYDALLTLFTTASCLLFFAYTEVKKTKYLYAFFLFLILAVYTKSVTGLLFIPGLFMYSLITKQFLSLLKNKHLYIGIAATAIIIASYYFLREIYNPGYFKAVQLNELGGRYLETLEGHDHGFWYYYTNMKDNKFSVWLAFIPVGVFIGLFSKNQKINRITSFSIILIVTFFLILSSAQTKLNWYDVPLYPFLAILVAVVVSPIFGFFQNQDLLKQKLKMNFAPWLLLFAFFFYPYREILSKTYQPKEWNKYNNEYLMSYHLREAIRGQRHIDNQKILFDGYLAHLAFYQEILKDQGANVSFGDMKTVLPGDTVIVVHSKVIDYLKNHYVTNVVDTDGKVVTYSILEAKVEK